MFALTSLVFICFLGLVLLTTIFWVWMLIDCITNRSLRDTEKILWVLVIFFTHILGAIIYFVVGRSRRS